MKKFQVSNIATRWKITEEEVMKFINEHGTLEVCTFEQVDGYFKAHDWSKRQAKWREFKGVSIKFSKWKFYVEKGLYDILKRFFEKDDVHYSEARESALSINSHFVTFSQCLVYGSKSCSKSTLYMYVKIHGTREQITSGKHDTDTNRIFIIPYRKMLYPVKENTQSNLHFEEYLEENSDTTFTQKQLDAWRKANTLRVYSGELYKRTSRS